MDKDVASASPAEVRSVSSAAIAVQEHEEKHRLELVDLEQNAMGESLSRVASGPPYSIFSPRAKMFIVGSVSVSALISPLGATTFYPVLPKLAEQLQVTPAMVNLSVTTYMVCPPFFLPGRPAFGG